MEDWSRRAPAIRIPSAGNDSDTGQAAERGRVNISWSTADVSGNATMSNVTGRNASEGGADVLYGWWRGASGQGSSFPIKVNLTTSLASSFGTGSWELMVFQLVCWNFKYFFLWLNILFYLNQCVISWSKCFLKPQQPIGCFESGTKKHGNCLLQCRVSSRINCVYHSFSIIGCRKCHVEKCFCSAQSWSFQFGVS